MKTDNTSDQGRQTTGFSVELDRGYYAQVLIPADITPAECQRLANVLQQFVKPARPPAWASIE